ncbi:hypothetical protein [uncultured Paracoccus sp.]|uniref:hypothetical protein n=1 Tax=uncultured Paracoccus sp. TaxID=189685 RepID=UPI0026106E5C|nr:hypothetical protein [uncultured Paracoccus sp.]
MADLDSGHIFLTTLAPIKGVNSDSGTGISHEQRVRIALAQLPTALQSPATQGIGINSPLARNRRTHLARMFVLSDIVYNGRNPQNPLVATAKGIDPVDPLPIDQLSTAYLVFCADVDAIMNDGDPLPHNLTKAQQKAVRASYARKLWDTMGDELQNIYQNCVGFEGVKTADDFAAYLDKCHVETTMPFHDYYLDLPKFNQLNTKLLLGAVLVPAAIAVLSLLLRIFGMLHLPMLGFSTFWTFVIAAVVTAVVALLAIGYALRNGAKPLAPAKHDDLPSVLKGLYVQQTFSDFVIDHQASEPDELHRAFGDYLARHRPENKMSPTQTPGVISIRAEGGVTL